MSFKYFRHTLRKVNTTQKAPAAKNTASAERFSDLIDGSDILTNNSVEQHLADVKVDDHGHSILKESGLTRGHSILDSSGTTKIASLESFLGHKGEQSENQFGADGARAAGGFGQAMAGSSGEVSLVGFVQAFITTVTGGMPGVAMADSFQKAASETVETMSDTKSKILRAMENTAWDPKKASDKESPKGEVTLGEPEIINKPVPCEEPNDQPEDSSTRPGIDDNNGGEGGFMTWKQLDQLSNGLNNVKDPITNPNGDDLGSGYLSDADLVQMEADLRNAKDPATNWGDDTYNNFMGAIEMNFGEISLKAPATNWGDNDTSNSDNVVDTLFTVQNDF